MTGIQYVETDNPSLLKTIPDSMERHLESYAAFVACIDLLQESVVDSFMIFSYDRFG